MPFKYNAGFGSELQSDALGDALPPFGNNPQKCPYDLYAEQISGTAFTVPRKDNKRTWMYRIQPSVLHAPFKAVEKGALSHGAFVAENGERAEEARKERSDDAPCEGERSEASSEYYILNTGRVRRRAKRIRAPR